MSEWRPALPHELPALWPAARTSHISRSLAELEEFYRTAPWRVRVSTRGDAMVLRTWRDGMGALAIRGAWAPDYRLVRLVSEAVNVARAHGYTLLVSPLVSRTLLRRYLEAGMAEAESIVALQAAPHRVVMSLDPALRGLRLRAAGVNDIESLVAVDAEAFELFWRYGPVEFAECLREERLVIAEREDVVVGYSSDSIWGSTCTIGRLAVSPSHRRQGVASVLLRGAALRAQSEGVALLSLCTQEENRASRSLYARAGFHEVDERYGLATVDVAEGSQVSG